MVNEANDMEEEDEMFFDALSEPTEEIYSLLASSKKVRQENNYWFLVIATTFLTYLCTPITHRLTLLKELLSNKMLKLDSLSSLTEKKRVNLP